MKKAFLLFLLLAIAFHLNFSCFLSSYLSFISIFGFESQNTSAKSRICVLIQSKMLEKINATQPYKSTLGPKIEKRIKATYQISCKWRTHFLKINKHWYSAYSAGESTCMMHYYVDCWRKLYIGGGPLTH